MNNNNNTYYNMIHLFENDTKISFLGDFFSLLYLYRVIPELTRTELYYS